MQKNISFSTDGGFLKQDFNVSTVRVRCLMEAIPQNRFDVHYCFPTGCPTKNISGDTLPIKDRFR